MADRYASLKQGLVGCWIPSISGSGLLLPDLSGRGNNGSLVGMDASDWVSSGNGRALDFDGTDDWVNLGDVLGFAGSNQTISISWWAYLKTANDAMRPFSKCRNSLTNSGWEVASYLDAGVYYVYWFSANALSPNRSFVQAIASGSALQWRHYAITFNAALGASAGTKIYENTALLTNQVLESGSTAIAANALTAKISASDSTASPGTPIGFTPAVLDDIRIYNRALTEPEIRLLASEPGIGFKPAKKLSRFSQRYTYNPPKAKVFEGVRVRDHDYSSLRQGLVGAWCPSLPNGGSGNTLPDQSGYNNHGTLTNMSPDDWVSSQYGRALDFDGVDDEVTTNAISSLNSATQFTITYWANKNNALSDMLVGSRLSSTNGVWLQWYSDGVVYFSVRNGQQNFIQHSLTYRSDFIHFAATYSNTSSAIYIDGRSVASGTNGTVSSTGFDDFGIGALFGGFFAAGKIDDVRLYNRALTEPEIRLLASRRGIGLQPSPTRFIAREKKTGLRRRILTGQT